jgi:ABC-type antimicrobial peptide transport system permease subunit
MAYSVSRREREFGIRMALGANRGSIVKMLLTGVLRLTLIGMLLGAGLVLLMRALVQASFGPTLGADNASPLALVLGALLLCLVATLATLVPARRAMSVEPMQALRTE